MLVNVGFDGDFVDSLLELSTHEDDIDVEKEVADYQVRTPFRLNRDQLVFRRRGANVDRLNLRNVGKAAGIVREARRRLRTLTEGPTRRHDVLIG